MIGIDLGKLQRAHAKFLADHQAMVRKELERAGHLAADHVRRHSLFKRRSPKSLKDDTKHTIAKTASGLRLRLNWSKHYAGYIEYGTRAHVIRPRGPWPLRFYSAKAGRWISTYKVNHPGTKPYKFGWRASNAAHRALGDLLTHGMRRVAA